MTGQAFQEAIDIEQRRARKPLPPFVSRKHITDEDRAAYLESVVPGMGAQPAPPFPKEPYPVEEQYEVSERRAFNTTTTPAYYDIITPNPKQILIESETVDHYVDFNQQIDPNQSPKVFASTTLTVTGKGTTRLWYQAVTGTGTIRILITKR